MLLCSCNWIGVNLVPNKQDNTARCPKCNNIFKGITAENAVAVSEKNEKEIVTQSAAFLLLIEGLQKA